MRGQPRGGYEWGSIGISMHDSLLLRNRGDTAGASMSCGAIRERLDGCVMGALLRGWKLHDVAADRTCKEGSRHQLGRKRFTPIPRQQGYAAGHRAIAKDQLRPRANGGYPVNDP